MTEIKWRDYAACKNAPYSLFTSRDGENEPSYPPKQITVVRGAQRLDIETLESVMTTSHIEAPVVPANYKCCVAPKM